MRKSASEFTFFTLVHLHDLLHLRWGDCRRRPRHPSWPPHRPPPSRRPPAAAASWFLLRRPWEHAVIWYSRYGRGFYCACLWTVFFFVFCFLFFVFTMPLYQNWINRIKSRKLLLFIVEINGWEHALKKRTKVFIYILSSNV